VSIAKIKTNDSARATFRYAVSKEGARVIGGDAAPWVERNLLSEEQLREVVTNATQKFMVSLNLNTRVKRSVGHTSIAFPPGEELDDRQMADYCEKYLAAMIVTSERPELLKNFNQSEFRQVVDEFRDAELPKYIYSIVRHTDEPHPHAHIVYSRINLETEKAISNSFERYRSQEILRDLERQYQLEVLPNSWEVGRKAQSISQIEEEIKTGLVSVKMRLQDLLEQVGQGSATVLEFIENAHLTGIEVRMNFTRTGKSKGISYGLDGVAFSGNSLGTRYSFKHSAPGLCKTFTLAYTPEQDNPLIQQCQRPPLSHDQRQQNLLRDDIASSLSRTAAAIQQLDQGPTTPTGTPNFIRESGSHALPRRRTKPDGQWSQSPAVTPTDAGTPQFGQPASLSDRNQPTARRLKPTQFPSIGSLERTLESRRTNERRSSGTEDSGTRNQFSQIDSQRREFEQNSQQEIQRINARLAELNHRLDERRSRRLKQQQVQIEWAAQILPIAQRLFEFYAAQSEKVAQDPQTPTEHFYQVEINGTCYRLSRDEATMTNNVRREDTGFNLQTHQGITKQDTQNWQSLQDWLNQQQAQLERSTTPSEPPANLAISLTLEQVGSLTSQQWSQLTPKQQINLVQAAQSHQKTKPRVDVQVEQWVGQSAQLKRRLKDLSDRAATEKEARQKLENRGQRSLLNPFGATAEQLSDARESLRTTQQVWRDVKSELDEIQKRQSRRQQQEGFYREWVAMSETQGTQRITELLQDPELRSQYMLVEQTVGQLQQWQQAAPQLGRTATEVEQISQVEQAYLNGQQISAPLREVIQSDLKLIQQRHQRRTQERGFER